MQEEVVPVTLLFPVHTHQHLTLRNVECQVIVVGTARRLNYHWSHHSSLTSTAK